jgi:ParB family chromosome partitioning protein
MQIEIAERIVKQQWSVRATENAVRRLAGTEGAARSPANTSTKQSDPDVRRLESHLAETLGAAVSIEHGTKGGRVVIRYHGLEELEGILAHIK